MRLFLLLMVSPLSPSPLSAREGALRFDRLTPESGISNGAVSAITQDELGFLWLGTHDGLNRFDGYRFKSFEPDPDQGDSLSGGYVTALLADRRGVLWVGTKQGGLNRFDRATETFVRYRHSAGDPRSLSSDFVSSLLEDESGTLWVGTTNGLNRLDHDDRFTRYLGETSSSGGYEAPAVNALHEDRTGRLWVATSQGLARFEPKGERFVFFSYDPEDPRSLGHPVVMAIAEDDDGHLWLGTGAGLNRFDPEGELFVRFPHDPHDAQSPGPSTIGSLRIDHTGVLWMGSSEGGGLSRLDLATGIFSHSRHDRADPRSLVSDLTLSVFEDSSGVLWFGSFIGISKYDTRRDPVVTYRRQEGARETLSASDIWALVEDSTGILWVGTPTDGLNRFDRRRGSVTNYRFDDQDPGTLQRGPVTTLYEDRSGILWVGTWGGGLSRFDAATERFVHFRHDPGDPHTLPSNRVQALLDDTTGRLWVGTLDGIGYLDRESGKFVRYPLRPEHPAGLGLNPFYSVYEDRSGDLWLGSDGTGLFRLRAGTDRFEHYPQNPAEPHRGPVGNGIGCMWEDLSGALWIGTFSGGLSRLDPARQEFVHYREKDGLASDVVVGLLGDDQGYLWLATHSGIDRFDPRTETFKNFDRDDGVQGSSFAAVASFRSPSGEMFFGGSEGLNAFYPDRIEDDPQVPQVQITEFRLFNQQVALSDVDPESPLQHSITETRDIVLTHAQYNFSFEFAALHYASPHKNRYRYRLEGFDRDWISADASQRLAPYSGVPPGSYTFRVLASNPDGAWNEEGAAITVTILPPLWRTWWAYSLYSVAVFSALWLFLRAHKKKLERERAINSRLRQVDKLKDQFLANTSHELRTPLNGIIGLADSLIDGVSGDLPEEAKRQLSIVVATGKRLTNLVGDVLDFSKLKSHNIELRRRPVDLCTLAEVVITLSRAMVGGKDLALVNEIPANLPAVFADENRLQQILYNLLGNAVKFTKAGRVTVSATAEGDLVTVCVADTGIGIAEEKFERIFESFEQADGSTERNYGGTGLGLTVTRQLVELHGGRIWVESTPGQGSRFFFTLESSDEPATTTEARAQEIVHPIVRPASLELESELAASAAGPSTEGNGVTFPCDFTILIVDDEPVNRLVIKNYLARQPATILEAAGGEQALAALGDGHQVDLVLLDIMMPKISGYEVCERLRERYSAYELPIIFLSARNQVTDLIDAFTKGANDYLTKPVAKNELLSRLKIHLQLLDTHRHLEEKLEERAGEIRLRNQELETMDTIVKTINEEIELTNVIHTILEQGTVLFPQAEKARFLLFDEELEAFRFVASIGYEIEELERTFTRSQATARFSEGARSLEHGVCVVHPFRLIGSPKSRLIPASTLVMTVIVSGELEGFLLLDSFGDQDAFQDSDLATMQRFREHAILALARAERVEQRVLEQKARELEERNRELERFTHTISHDLRNPLTTIQLFSDCLERDLKSGSHRTGEDLEKVRRAAETMEQLMGDLVELSEIGCRIRSEKVDLAPLVRAAFSAPDGEISRRHGSLTIAPDLPVVSGDRRRLTELMQILISNAVKFAGPDNAPEITVGARASVEETVIFVRDNGIGIEERYHASVFGLFDQLDPKCEGTGVGLALAKRIVEVHGGRIWVESQGRGSGSTFCFTLPQDGPDLDVRRYLERGARIAAPGGHDRPGANVRVRPDSSMTIP